MMVTYGHQVTSDNDEYVNLAEAVRDTAAGAPGSKLVEFMPFCERRHLSIFAVRVSLLYHSIVQHIPAWFPGAAFKRHGLFARELGFTMRDKPFQQVKKHLVSLFN